MVILRLFLWITHCSSFRRIRDYKGGNLEDTITYVEMYLASYKALKDKIANGENLTKDERNLFNGLKEELDDFERGGKNCNSTLYHISLCQC